MAGGCAAARDRGRSVREFGKSSRYGFEVSWHSRCCMAERSAEPIKVCRRGIRIADHGTISCDDAIEELVVVDRG